MNSYILSLLAFTGGVFIAMQSALNSRLGTLLSNPFIATFIAFLTSSAFALIYIILSRQVLPNRSLLASIPVYLWFFGGLCAVCGVTLYYYTIPKLGISTMVSLGLSGQLIFAAIAGHYGWFNLPVQTIDLKRLLGMFSIVFGILLINRN